MVDAKVAPADTVDAKVLLSVLAQVKAGDFTARMPLEWTGVPGKVADGLNHVIAPIRPSGRSWPGSAESWGSKASSHNESCSEGGPRAGLAASNP